MEEALGVPVKNLSSAGAFTTDGLRMAAKIAPEDQVILIEIGGDDLIAGVRPPFNLRPRLKRF